MSVPTASAVKSVIVADDTAFVRDRFKTALANAGHQVLTARTATDLLAAVREKAAEIDLIVVDLALPHGHGTDLIRTLQKIEGLKAPIVVFSGTIASASEVRELTGLGIAGYVNEYTSVQHIARSLAPHLFPDSHNRRTSPRVVLAIPITYRFGNTIASGLSINISTGGVAVRTTSPLEPGTEVKVRFKLPEGKGEVEAGAKVSWVDRLVGMGLEFTKVEGEHRRTLDEFVQTHFFTNRKA
jgi:uncharacterized protein (TIGR02266 family)